MRFDVFLKNLTKAEAELTVFAVKFDKRFDFNGRTSPHLTSEVNQATEREQIASRLVEMRDSINEIIDSLLEVPFNNTYDRSTWSEAIMREEKQSSEVKMKKLNITSQSDEIAYLNELNFKLQKVLHKLEGDFEKPFVFLNKLADNPEDEILHEVPKGWNWGIIPPERYSDKIMPKE